jgi:hypothetical protein
MVKMQADINGSSTIKVLISYEFMLITKKNRSANTSVLVSPLKPAD